MPSLTREIPVGSPLHGKLVKMLEGRIKMAQRDQQKQHERWQKSEDTVLCYVPESELDAARKNDRESNGTPRYTTIKLPYTYALLMSQHTYLTSVFFSRSPVHQFAGRHGEGEQKVQAMEALVAYQLEVGEMLGPYYIWLYDACKYGVGILEEYWNDERVQFSSLQDMPDPNDPTGQTMVKGLVRVQMPGYRGTKINNISPWDFYPDPRVSVGNYQRGEFVFIRKNISWSDVVKRKARGFYMNIEHITNDVKDFAGTARGANSNNSQLERPDETLMLEDADDMKHPAIVPVYEGCVELLPSEWGLGNSDYPEKWMFTITGDLKTLIGVQPHGAMHCEFPYAVIESEIEGYGTWNRGLPDTAEALQNTMDWLINQHFYNVRASLNNQFLIDPSKVIVSGEPGPGFRWRLRPEAYGQDVRQFFYQVPVQDVTRTHVQDIATIVGIGERSFGMSDQMMGANTGTNRKTATEVRASTGFGVGRQKTIAEYISATGMARHVQRMVQLSQQYFSVELKLKIAGSMIADMSPNDQQRFIDVRPDDIKGFFDLVPVDGTMPVDKLALANLWKDLLLQMRQVPGLLMQYDLSRIFGHVAQLAGIRNLGQFRIEMNSPQALIQQADAGNVVPFGPGASNPAGVPKALPGSMA